jgi:oligoendopeptidase F
MYSPSAQIVLLYEVKLPLMNDEKKSKKRKHQLRVCVNDEEKAQIEKMVESVSQGSASSYLRVLGLGFEPNSIIDDKALLELSKINADQSRLGNLLKMLLANDGRQSEVTTQKVNSILRDIQEIQSRLLTAVENL